MRVIRADVMGLCFGVRDALAVIDGIEEPSTVTIHGQLVHNEVVQARLAVAGVRDAERGPAGAELPETPAVLVTAHGISDRERGRLEAAGKRLVDTTCPLVPRVHQAAQALEAEGYHVLVIGRRGHVEVEGIVGDLDHSDVIESVDEVDVYPHRRLGIVCQTTATERARRVDPGGDRRAEPGRRDPVRRHGLPADQGASACPGSAARPRRGGRGRRRPQLEQHPRAGRALSRTGQARAARPVGRRAGCRLVQGLRHGRPHRGHLDACRRPSRRSIGPSSGSARVRTTLACRARAETPSPRPSSVSKWRHGHERSSPPQVPVVTDRRHRPADVDHGRRGHPSRPGLQGRPDDPVRRLLLHAPRGEPVADLEPGR